MADLSVDKRNLYKNGILIYSFEHDIAMTASIESYFLVLLENKNWKEIYNRNLFCFNNDGNLVWRNIDQKQGVENAHYVNISVKDGELWAVNYYGTEEQLLDKNTGHILKTRYTK